jgi:hypothetical protein
MENHTNRVAMARAEAAHAVAQIDPIYPARALYWPMVNREHNGVTLSERDHFRT